MIVLKDLKPLWEYLEWNDFVGIPGFFGARKGSKMIKRWIESMEGVLKGSKPSFSGLIQPLLKDPEFKEFEPLTKEMICPIYHTGDEFWKLFETHKAEEFITDKTYVFTLYNSAFSEEIKKMPVSELLHKSWLISDVFRKALCDTAQ